MEPTELPSLPDARFAGLLDEARALQPRTIELRRELHRQPEQGLTLPNTQAAVRRALDDLGLQITLGTSTTSLTAVLHGGAGPGPAVLLRGDMDALPLHEDTGLEYASTVDGSMHACGHDAHVAMLASAARLLSAHAEELSGSVVFMFQPGEEGHHGARHMIHEGVLDAAGSRVRQAFALHMYANAPCGYVYTKPGPILASEDSFFIKVTGEGGHGATPHQAVDPVPAAAAMVGALQTMITRKVSVFEPAVLSVTKLEAGTTTNIIPETAELTGTIRALSDHSRTLVREQLDEVCEGIARAHGCRVVVDLEPGYPVTVNDHGVAEHVVSLAGEVLGNEHAGYMTDPIMGAEDFSYVLQRVPGAFTFLGGAGEGTEPERAASNHSNRVRYDESAFAHGVAMHAAFALDALR